MTGSFVGKVAIVTGGASGIGRAAALIFAQRGAKVVVADIDITQGNEVVSEINGHGGGSVFIKTDVGSDSAVAAMVELAVSRFGRLDVAFNNAGTPGPQKKLVDVTQEEFERTYLINATSCWLSMKHEIPAMLRTGGGAIVNTSSRAGFWGAPGMISYCGAKHAVIGMTRAAALEYAKQQVRVNAVCPGAIDTPMLRRSLGSDTTSGMMEIMNEPLGRLGKSEEVAEAAVWLCSDSASWVTGHAMPVDGGGMAGHIAVDQHALDLEKNAPQ